MSSSMGSILTGFSGLSAAQAGLYVTGHNLSNVNSVGYTRQRVEQKDAISINLSIKGASMQQVGLGTDVAQLRQIRDIFLDKSYRAESSHKEFYTMRYEVVNEVENIFGELEGSGRMSDVLNEMWRSMHELSIHPDGIEARSIFISNATAFLDKANDISKNLEDYQAKLNDEVTNYCQRLNQIAIQINDLNGKIALGRVSNDNPNDYLDARNNLLDELSTYAHISYYENVHGDMTVMLEGNDFIANGSYNPIGLQYTEENSGFVKPVYTTSAGVLDAKMEGVTEVFMGLFEPGKLIDASHKNDNGSLKSLLLARGKDVANYTTPELDVSAFTIPKIQREFDIMINKIITMFNDAFTPDPAAGGDAPKDLYGNSFKNTGELFVRKNNPRYSYDDSDPPKATLIKEDPTDPYQLSLLGKTKPDVNTLYTMGNIIMNPDIVNNYSLLPISINGDRGDNSLIEGLLQKWKNTAWTDGTGAAIVNPYAPQVNITSTSQSFEAYYASFVTRMGQHGQEAATMRDSEEQLLNQINNNRISVSGVSLDEEMTNMMKYQHSYNAAAKVINEMDSMIDRIVNRTGRVGL